MPTVRANAALGFTNLANVKLISKTAAICQSPWPKNVSSVSLSAIPKIIPAAVSTTLRGLASRVKPNEVMATVTASIGIACPSP